MEYRESLYVGYRYYDTAGVPTAFPFGYGLSYTSFAYSDLQADAQGVTLTVTNTGSCAGMWQSLTQRSSALPRS